MPLELLEDLAEKAGNGELSSVIIRAARSSADMREYSDLFTMIFLAVVRPHNGDRI